MKPGFDLDLQVANVMGLIACDGYEPMNFGSAGGPALRGTTCVHAHGACYPIAETGGIGGRVGGVPEFSNDDHWARLRLKEFPGGYTLHRLSKGFSVEDSDGNCWFGDTEAHALCLAYLEAGLPPKFTEETRWNLDWLDAALQYGLVTHEALHPQDLPNPWTPQTVLSLHRAIQFVRGEALSRIRREDRMAQEAANPTPNTVFSWGDPPNPPQTNPTVQNWLWKMAESGLGDAEMAKVNKALKRVWEEPESAIGSL